MTIREDLGGDHWVEFIDPDELTSKHQRKVQNYAVSNGAAGLSYFLAQRDAILFFCVTGWSFSAPLPTDQKAMDKLSLPMRPYRKLCGELEKYAKNLQLNDDEADEDGDPPAPSDS